MGAPADHQLRRHQVPGAFRRRRRPDLEHPFARRRRLARAGGLRALRATSIAAGRLRVAAAGKRASSQPCPRVSATSVAPDPLAPEPSLAGSWRVSPAAAPPGRCTCATTCSSIAIPTTPATRGLEGSANRPTAPTAGPTASTVVFYDLAARGRRSTSSIRRARLAHRRRLRLRLGVAHILTGADHLAFLAGAAAGGRGSGGGRPGARSAAHGGRPSAAPRPSSAPSRWPTRSRWSTQVLRPGTGAPPAGSSRPSRFRWRYVALREPAAAPARARRWALVFAFGLVHGLGLRVGAARDWPAAARPRAGAGLVQRRASSSGSSWSSAWRCRCWSPRPDGTPLATNGGGCARRRRCWPLRPWSRS